MEVGKDAKPRSQHVEGVLSVHAWALRSEEKFAQEIELRDTGSFISSNRNMFEGQVQGEDGVVRATDMNEIALREVTVLQREGELRREPLEHQLFRGR